MRQILFVILSTLLLSSCLFSRPQAPDAEADTKLGVETDEQADDAHNALSQIREQQSKEQQRTLERQITDPSINPSVNEQ